MTVFQINPNASAREIYNAIYRQIRIYRKAGLDNGRIYDLLTPVLQGDKSEWQFRGSRDEAVLINLVFYTVQPYDYKEGEGDQNSHQTTLASRGGVVWQGKILAGSTAKKTGEPLKEVYKAKSRQFYRSAGFNKLTRIEKKIEEAMEQEAIALANEVMDDPIDQPHVDSIVFGNGYTRYQSTTFLTYYILGRNEALNKTLDYTTLSRSAEIIVNTYLDALDAPSNY